MVHTSDTIRGTASDTLQGRTIILGVAGSIAAVKTVELARELIRHGAEVRAVMTGAAARIIHPDALHFATGHPPILALSGAVEHVDAFGPGGYADLLLIAPATANTIAKMALGIDDTALTTFACVALGAKNPVVIAPAMHGPMEDNAPTQRHIAALKEQGVRFVRPLYDEGKAKLAPVEAIVSEVQRMLGPRTLEGERVLVVSGAGSEPVDPVRVLTNRSSGRMGRALAFEAHRAGADLTILTSDDDAGWPPGADVRPFVGVRDLLATLQEGAAGDAPRWIFCPAALADYAPDAADTKLPSEDETLDLRLVRLPKVLPELRRLHPDARIVGWKLQDTLEEAVQASHGRLARYGIDAVVANGAASLGGDITEAAIVTADRTVPIQGSKRALARRLIEVLTGGDEEG